MEETAAGIEDDEEAREEEVIEEEESRWREARAAGRTMATSFKSAASSLDGTDDATENQNHHRWILFSTLYTVYHISKTRPAKKKIDNGSRTCVSFLYFSSRRCSCYCCCCYIYVSIGVKMRQINATMLSNLREEKERVHSTSSIEINHKYKIPSPAYLRFDHGFDEKRGFPGAGSGTLFRRRRRRLFSLESALGHDFGG